MRQPQRTTIRVATIVITAALGIGTGAPTALAGLNTTRNWSNNDYVGYCAQTSGGYVIAAQSFLWGQGLYSLKVDNIWGDASHLALGNYQIRYGLTPYDSCAGPITWNHMQSRLINWGSQTNPRYQSTSSGRYAWFNYARPSSTTSCRWTSFTDTPSNYQRGTSVLIGSYDFQQPLSRSAPTTHC